jgi:hypothetical protein
MMQATLPPSVSDISLMIQSKERELHQFHDLRCAQLESLVEERDQLLLESSKRFEKLKEDFEYNLTLIEARDIEIERLERELQKANETCEQSKTEKRNLSIQLELSQTKEIEKEKKAEQERVNNKVGHVFVFAMMIHL